VHWNGSQFAVLLGDELQFRDSQLNLVTAFSFFSAAPNNPRHSHLHWSEGRYFGWSGTAADQPTGRLFGELGCDAP
jgi:hypothetical protein